MTEKPNYEALGKTVRDTRTGMLMGRFGSKEAARQAAAKLNKDGKITRC